MSYLLISDWHNSITLSEDEAAHFLKENNISRSKLTAIKEFGENALIYSGAVIAWSNNGS